MFCLLNDDNESGALKDKYMGFKYMKLRKK